MVLYIVYTIFQQHVSFSSQFNQPKREVEMSDFSRGNCGFNAEVRSHEKQTQTQLQHISVWPTFWAKLISNYQKYIKKHNHGKYTYIYIYIYPLKIWEKYTRRFSSSSSHLDVTDAIGNRPFVNPISDPLEYCYIMWKHFSRQR